VNKILKRLLGLSLRARNLQHTLDHLRVPLEVPQVRSLPARPEAEVGHREHQVLKGYDAIRLGSTPHAGVARATFIQGFSCIIPFVSGSLMTMKWKGCRFFPDGVCLATLKS